MTALWQPAPRPDDALTAQIALQAGLSPVIASIVARRAPASDWQSWLNPCAQPLADPFLIPGMEEATSRIRAALASHSPITVFGDYDADGLTGTSLLVKALKQLGANVKPFFPDRASEGYGLTSGAVERCLTFEPVPELVITVDCGISCAEEVKRLRERGIDVVVTDHHALPEVIPEACAVVTAQLLPEEHPLRNICGCATAFMLAHALFLRDGRPELEAEHFLDLVAVATLADVVPLLGENRVLTAKGLRAFGDAQGNAGLHALAREQKCAQPQEAEAVAFGIVPCINAASRMGQLRDAYRVIGLERADAVPALLSANAKRKQVERDLLSAVLARSPEAQKRGNILIVGGEDFHPGVIGIVAARLMEQTGLSTAIVCTDSAGGGHGSMRAFGAWHAVEALKTVSDLLTNYGGHAKAAGFTIKPGAFEAFCERLPRAFEGATPESEPSTFEADLSDTPITLGLCEEIRRLEPCGKDNPVPIFRATCTVESCRVIGKDRRHLSLALTTPAQKTPLKAVWFGGAEKLAPEPTDVGGCGSVQRVGSAEKGAPFPPGTRLSVYFKLSIDTFSTPQPSLNILAATPFPSDL